MTESTVANKIDELTTNRQEALQMLQEAQTKVTELNALIQRQSGVTAAIGAAAGTGAVEVTWPIALVAAAYVLGQAYVDAHAK